MNFNDLLSKNVKLEFGNKEQILAIDRHIEQLRKQEENEQAKTPVNADRLKRYHVVIDLSGSVEVDGIVAYSAGEAIEAARLKWDRYDIDNYETEHEEAFFDGFADE